MLLAAGNPHATFSDPCVVTSRKGLNELVSQSCLGGLAHLAVANAEAASQWGTAASIWPLGATTYAWGPTVFWPTNTNAQNVAKSLRVDEGLADCILSKKEVLYACDASIAVPRALEASLRAGLGLL